MAIPNIDTFENDIANEIKSKEASITDIASASNDVGNTPTAQVNTSRILVLVGILCLVLIIGIATLLYFFMSRSQEGTAPPVQTATTTSTQIQPSENLLPKVSPALYSAVGASFGGSKMSEYGYAFSIAEYTPVFAYMLKNEVQFADELAVAVGSGRDTSTTTPPFEFVDVTMNNQNMRVGTSADKIVVYAFVNTHTLIVSSSTEGILALRSGILAK